VSCESSLVQVVPRFARPFYLSPLAGFDFRLSIFHNSLTFIDDRRPDDQFAGAREPNLISREIARLPASSLVTPRRQYKRHDLFRVLLRDALDEETEFSVTPLRTGGVVGGGRVGGSGGGGRKRRRGGSRFADDDNGAGVSFANPRSGIRARARALTSFCAFRLAKRHS